MQELHETNRLLKLFTVQSTKKEYLDAVVGLLREWTGCEAAGIRVLDREGNIPYESCAGFSRAFLESESPLSVYRDRCICIRVVAGRPGAHGSPYVTVGGGFHCGDMAQMEEGLPPDAVEKFRGRCTAEGYASVAVMPIAYRDRVVGAIHLADRGKAKIRKETIDFIESVHPLIGEAIHRFGLEEERERLQEQLLQSQKMEALGTAAGGIAHDFNNILAAIIGFTESVRGRAEKDSRDERILGRVVEAGLRGRELVKQMLTFARKTAYEKKPLRLSGVIRETMALVRASMPAAVGITIKVDSESGLVMGDPNQIQQVLMNLCTNGADAMREKGGTLEVGLSDYSVPTAGEDIYGIRPGLYMKLWVRDTGEGMAPEVISRIFDPFFTTKRAGQGTGLGLSVVHGIVKQHGGYVAAESESGKGSLFTVYLPTATGIPSREAVSGDDCPGGSERILFVDDEEAQTEMGKELLEELGYRVKTCRGPGEALELVKAGAGGFDLIITDQAMPQMTGMEMAKKILDLAADVPIILCTGFSHLVDAGQARTAGIRAFVMKPLTKNEIARTIRKVLDK
jgi:signal transduction histidine kinase/CheY-like chemotaxis protein